MFAIWGKAQGPEEKPSALGAGLNAYYYSSSEGSILNADGYDEFDIVSHIRLFHLSSLLSHSPPLLELATSSTACPRWMTPRRITSRSRGHKSKCKR